MTSFFAQIWILIKNISPYTKKCLLKLVGISLALVLFTVLFRLCNEIPTTTMEVSVNTYNLPRYRMELHAFLGRGVFIKNPLDSTYWSPFFSSGRIGVAYSFSSDSIPGKDLTRFSSAETERRISQLKERFPEDHMVDSLESMIESFWKFHSSSKKISIHTERSYRDAFNMSPEDSLYFIQYLTNRDKGYIESKKWLLFRNPQSEAYDGSYTKEYRSRFLYNSTLWSLCDVSQSYIGVNLTGWNKSDTLWHSWSKEGELENSPVEFTVDFGSSITPSHMIPEPDHITMTGVVFDSPEKIREIISRGLVFHVRYMQNQNIQSMKLFWLSTLLTVLATWLLTTLFKWFQHLFQNRGKVKKQ